jgi:hypothetical protein
MVRGKPVSLRVLAGGVAVLVALAAATYLLAPLAADTSDIKKPAEREKARNDARTAAIQLFGLAGLVVTGFFTYATLRVNHQGQITERFTRAIDQLGSDAGHVRLGGIYALERIARESKDDRGPIIEVLTGVLRERSRTPQGGREGRQSGVVDALAALVRERTEPSAPPTSGEPALEVQAVLTVLGRRDAKPGDGSRLDLSGVHLARADLSRGRFFGADFSQAHLEGAHLYGASLEESWVEYAHLEGANLLTARLEGAHMSHSHAQGAHFGSATGTPVLYLAELQGATLGHMSLGTSYPMRVGLQGAHLLDADCHGSNSSTQTSRAPACIGSTFAARS